MSKTYIVTDGDYSDYRILAVFDSRKLANRFTDSFGGDVEVHDTNPLEPLLSKGYKAYIATINIPDSFCTIKKLKDDYWYDYEDIGKATYDEQKKQLEIAIWAKNEKHAIKIASEKRAEFIVKMDWGIV